MSEHKEVYLHISPRDLRRTSSVKALGRSLGSMGRTLKATTVVFNPNAWDGDNDGLVQDSTPFERPAIPGVNDFLTRGIVDAAKATEAWKASVDQRRSNPAQLSRNPAPTETIQETLVKVRKHRTIPYKYGDESILGRTLRASDPSWLDGLTSKQIAELVVPENKESLEELLFDMVVGGKVEEYGTFKKAMVKGLFRRSLDNYDRLLKDNEVDFSPESVARVRKVVESTLDTSPAFLYTVQNFGLPPIHMLSEQTYARRMEKKNGADLYGFMDLTFPRIFLGRDYLDNENSKYTLYPTDESIAGDYLIDNSLFSTIVHEYAHFLQYQTINYDDDGINSAGKISKEQMQNMIAIARKYQGSDSFYELDENNAADFLDIHTTPLIPRASSLYAHTNKEETFAEGIAAFLHPNPDVRGERINEQLKNDIEIFLDQKILPRDESKRIALESSGRRSRRNSGSKQRLEMNTPRLRSEGNREQGDFKKIGTVSESSVEVVTGHRSVIEYGQLEGVKTEVPVHDINGEKIAFGLDSVDDPNVKVLPFNPYEISGKSPSSEEGMMYAALWFDATVGQMQEDSSNQTKTSALLYAAARGDKEALYELERLGKVGNKEIEGSRNEYRDRALKFDGTTIEERDDAWWKRYPDVMVADKTNDGWSTTYRPFTIDDIVMVHQTSYHPEIDADGNFRIKPPEDHQIIDPETGKPWVNPITGELQGVHRSSVHFALNHIVEGHMYRPTPTGSTYAVIIPARKMIDANPGALDNLYAVDTWMTPKPDDGLLFPKESVQIVKLPGLSDYGYTEPPGNPIEWTPEQKEEREKVAKQLREDTAKIVSDAMNAAARKHNNNDEYNVLPFSPGMHGSTTGVDNRMRDIADGLGVRSMKHDGSAAFEFEKLDKNNRYNDISSKFNVAFNNLDHFSHNAKLRVANNSRFSVSKIVYERSDDDAALFSRGNRRPTPRPLIRSLAQNDRDKTSGPKSTDTRQYGEQADRVALFSGKKYQEIVDRQPPLGSEQKSIAKDIKSIVSTPVLSDVDQFDVSTDPFGQEQSTLLDSEERIEAKKKIRAAITNLFTNTLEIDRPLVIKTEDGEEISLGKKIRITPRNNYSALTGNGVKIEEVRPEDIRDQAAEMLFDPLFRDETTKIMSISINFSIDIPEDETLEFDVENLPVSHPLHRYKKTEYDEKFRIQRTNTLKVGTGTRTLIGIVDKDGNFQITTVLHDSLTIDKGLKGSGIGTIINAKNETIYKELGVKRILTQGLSSNDLGQSSDPWTGASHWPKNGFMWAGERGKQEFIAIIHDAITNNSGKYFAPGEKEKISKLYTFDEATGTFETEATPEELLKFKYSTELFMDRNASIFYERRLDSKSTDSDNVDTRPLARL